MALITQVEENPVWDLPRILLLRDVARRLFECVFVLYNYLR